MFRRNSTLENINFLYQDHLAFNHDNFYDLKNKNNQFYTINR